MATLLIGYDTESAAVGEGLARFLGPEVPQYRLALDPESTRRGVALLARLHEELEAPVHLLRLRPHPAARAGCVRDAGRVAALRHPAAHLQPRRLPRRALPPRGRRAARPCWRRRRPSRCARSSRFTSELIRRYLGRECIGLRTPFGYYRGLRDRPDLLRIVADTGHRYVSSWGRNEDNGNPTPWVQPFDYAEDGFAGILELPFQFWLDGIWFDAHGYGEGRAFRRALEGRDRRGRRAATSCSRPPSTNGARSRRTRRAPAGFAACSNTRAAAASKSPPTPTTGQGRPARGRRAGPGRQPARRRGAGNRHVTAIGATPRKEERPWTT